MQNEFSVTHAQVRKWKHAKCSEAIASIEMKKDLCLLIKIRCNQVGVLQVSPQFVRANFQASKNYNKATNARILTRRNEGLMPWRPFASLCVALRILRHLRHFKDF
jgi:hypothetical protein